MQFLAPGSRAHFPDSHSRSMAAFNFAVARLRAPHASISATPADDSLRVCCVCKQLFRPSENHARACRFHTASFFSGRLQRVEPTDCSDLQFFWDCCGATERDAPGCTYGWHKSYDDE